MDSRLSARALVELLGLWRTSEPAYDALADGIRLLCLDNRIAPGTALPAERELAGALGVSRTTVAAAYRTLRGTGHIVSRQGSGSITRPLGRTTSARWFDHGGIDLQQASPPAWPGLPGVIAEVAGSATALVSRAGYDILGHLELRTAIAERYSRHGMHTDPTQIMVTNGAQHALNLIASTLLHCADRVLIETPTYPHAAETFRRAGSRLVGVPVTTEDGWDVDRAAQAFARARPVLAYLMPEFQNPTGRSMTPAESHAFERAAHDAGSTLLIDETTAELTIDETERPTPLGAAGPAIRVGSLGKAVWGGLRVGWIRAEEEVIRRLRAARAAHDLGTPDLEQAIATRVVSRLDEILPQRSTLLRSGRDALVAALARTVPEWSVPEVRGGVALWVGLGAPLSSALVIDAAAHGLHLSAGPRFAVEGGHERHLRIPFTAEPRELERAVEVLAASWSRVTAGTPRTSPVTALAEAVV
ncbi:PLP-dependent aminotransferase family protein [Microbacterium capsulatum]|uniref:PLP-dependent aminotransferase family protein n=1 Tax=Microbacterium capsulatum TaxID=3041921 RepID=A0ABU0XI35_9MICO|nr:PLP-dependent aminotransferase family protein [Microbacterium sp. ASV81]MDQ4214796.1 PLP-dependent aminotransferase family protein [Microbacterium sp. ASV81]